MGNNIFYSEMFIDKIIQQTNTNEHKIPYQMERMTELFSFFLFVVINMKLRIHILDSP